MSAVVVRNVSKPIATIVEFFTTETASGFLLIAAATAGLIWANSPAQDLYEKMLHAHLGFPDGARSLDLSVHQWINDGLMAVFFLLVGLEIKRELIVGELSSARRAAFPAIAAFGGMLVPALICAAFVFHDPVRLRGWAIPAATDIAFALAALRLAGAGLPTPLKVFLTALAIIDDLGAILIIALFYTSDLSFGALSAALGCAAILIVFNRLRVSSVVPYLLVGVGMWYFVLQSGVHATIAGVVLAMTIPIRDSATRGSPLKRLEHRLHPYVAFAIVPLFGLANAGVSFAGLSLSSLLAPLPLGIALGLFVGKQLGVYGFSHLAVASGLARRPHGITNGMLYGVSLLAGIGFTMSLFIGSLAFASDQLLTEAKVGLFAGSLLAAAAGYVVLRSAARRRTSVVDT